VYRDSSIPEERPSSEKSAPKKGQQYIVVKTSPRSQRGRSGTNSSVNQQTRGLLSHSSDSDDDYDDANGKLMKEQKKTKKHFSVGSDDDDDDEGGLQMKRS
jgi:hypothetical protein